MATIISLENLGNCELESVGGKAANLGQLIQFGFDVPRGFVIDAASYRDSVKGGAEAQSAGIELSQALVNDITAALAGYPADQAFAVRSSGTMEDLDGAAFAGLHDTFLNVRGADQIVRRVKDCYHSLWSKRAVAYRDERGFDHRQAAMAVVVQVMVPCDRAGVAFTVNPVNGNLGEMVIDANFGLGESVVGGETEVDHFVIDKKTLTVTAATAGEGKMQVVSHGSGTRTEALAPEKADALCLTDGELKELVELGLRVEAAFRFPQDLEWGFADGKLHIMQSRAITSIPAEWTRDESAERFPIAITPLTWDFVESGFHQSLNYSFELMGFPAFNGKWFTSIDHYIYGNQNAVKLYCQRSPFTIGSLDELRHALPVIREKFRWVQELPVTWSRNLDNHLIKVGRFSAEPLEQMDDPAVWNFINRINDHGTEYFLPNIAISITQSQLYHQLRHLLNIAIGQADTARLFPDLTGCCETKTGMINSEIYDLIQLIRKEPQLEARIRATASREVVDSGDLAAFTEFNARFEDFLRDHGHREVEFDAYYPTWVDAPWVVLDIIKQLLQHENLENPADKERLLKIKKQDAERELFGLLPLEFHFFFLELLRLTREYTRLDDVEHYHTTRLTLLIRRALMALGGRLAERGILDEARDIFFAHQMQINEAIETDSQSRWRKFTESVRVQKANFLTDQARTPDWIHGEDSAVDDDALYLSGIPGSGGSVEGTVYQLESSDDFAQFPKGAILVARTTSPSWTPVFYSAAAVITESGGPLSHGAVTARELGIPAVMSVRGSMKKLSTGQRVRIDGTSGRVVLI